MIDTYLSYINSHEGRLAPDASNSGSAKSVFCGATMPTERAAVVKISGAK